MGDSEEKRRPNAKYQLTNDAVKSDEIVYHYNRERRLAKAPQSVRDLYTAKPHRGFNLIKPLIKTKPLAMMFFSIVIIAVFIIVISILGLASDSRDLDGNRLLVQALRYEGSIIVAVNKTIPKTGVIRFFRSDQPYTGAVDIAVQPVAGADGDQPLEDIFYHRIFFSLEPEEYYRFSVPYDAGELALVFKTETKTLSLTVKPK